MIELLKKSIEQKTRLTWSEIIGNSRRKNLFFARMAVSVKCLEFMDLRSVSRLLNRDRTTIYYYIKRYPIDYESSKEFKILADKL